jgi:hypothetical protein
MLRHLQERIAAALHAPCSATLASSGPAGLQAQIVPCAARGMVLYLLVPRTSDQLLNVEHDGAVVVTTTHWHMQGCARVVARAGCPEELLSHPEAAWSTVVAVQPAKVSIAQRAGWGAAETIDVEEGRRLR